MASIRYINNSGGGFNGRKTVDDGTTIERFFAQQMPGEDPAKFNIRVNNAIPTEGQVLRENDLVSVIPGKYDGGAFGAEFMKNLQAAAEVGRLARDMPDLAGDLRAINELGAAVRATPNLAENLTALVGFVSAVKVLDRPADDSPSVADTGVDLTTAPAFPAPLATQLHVLCDALPRDEKVADLTRLVAEFGGVAGIREALARTTAPSADVDDVAVLGRVAPREIDTTPPAPGCVRLATGGGIGRAVSIEDGETVERFFGRIRPGADPEDYRIELNGTTADPERVLAEGDSVLIRDINAVKGRLAGGSSCT